MAPAPSDRTAAPRWRGVNHLALITNDMDATVRFYHGVLGARLACTIGNASFRHYFFDLGPHNTVAFFEYADQRATPFRKAAGVPDPRAPQFDHVAFDLPGEEDLLELSRRLKDAGCDVTEVIDHRIVRSIYFTDPNGIALEASYWLIDPHAADVDYSARDRFADPNPVPAVRELERSGELASPDRAVAPAAAEVSWQ